MDLKQITRAELLGENMENVSPGTNLPRDLLILPGTGFEFTALKSNSDYTIVLLNDLGDVAAVDKNGNEAGFYSSNSLIVHEEHRGQGLGVALALHAHANRNELPSARSLSEAGRKTLEAAWEVAQGLRSNPWWP